MSKVSERTAQKKKVVVLSLNSNLCSFIGINAFKSFQTTYIKAPNNNPSSISKPYSKPFQLFRTGWTTLNQGGLSR